MRGLIFANRAPNGISLRDLQAQTGTAIGSKRARSGFKQALTKQDSYRRNLAKKQEDKE